jgi:hypothetical protein
MDITEFVARNKRMITIVAINVVGVILLIWLVSFLMSSAAGELPSPNAPTSEIVKSLANDGWKLQPKDKKLTYVNNLIDVYARSPQKRDEFVEYVNKLPDWKVAQIQDNIVDVAKDQIVQDATEFSRLTTESERVSFINSKIGKMNGLRNMFRGQSSRGSYSNKNGKAGSDGPDLAKSKLAQGVSTEPNAVYSKVLDNSSPAERAKVDTYISKVEGQIQKLKKAGSLK